MESRSSKLLSPVMLNSNNSSCCGVFPFTSDKRRNPLLFSDTVGLDPLVENRPLSPVLAGRDLVQGIRSFVYLEELKEQAVG